MRIRTVFLLGFLAAALPGLGVTAWRAAEAWGAARQAERAILATRTVAALQRAQTAFSAQIGQLLAAAQAPTPDLEGTRRTGAAATALLAEGTAAATAAGFPARLPEEASRTVAALLRRVEAAAAQPPAQRDPALVRDIAAARSGFGDRLGQLTQEAGRGLGADAPQLAALVEIASHAMALRDSLGRRSLLISSWLGGQPVTPAAHLGAAVLNGRAEQSWQELQRLVPALQSPALRQALEVQRRDFAETAEPRWRRLVEVAGARIGASGPEWPEPAASFRQWNVPALAGVVALRDAALEAALLTGEARLASGRWLLAGMLALILGLLGLAGAAVTVLLRRVVRPLGALTGAVTRIAGGTLDLTVPGHGRRDELGEMAKAVERLRAGSVERLAQDAAQASERTARLARAARVDGLLRNFETETAGALHAVAAAATELDTTANGMASTAADGTSRAAAVAGAAAGASDNVNGVAAATEELSASITEVVRHIEASAAAAREATEAARSTDATVRGLSEAAGRISDVVRLIGDIAGQTNLLALNATIEAARAGEAGKGFAVVASEVKALAGQTAKATEEIGQQITGIQAETARTVEVVGRIARIIERLNEATGVVADTAAQQAAATQEIGRAVAQAAAGAQEAAHHASGVSADAERTGEAAGAVRHASSELARQAEGLRGQVDGFLAAIRAA